MTAQARTCRLADLPTLLAAHDHAAYPNCAVTLERCDRPGTAWPGWSRIAQAVLLPPRRRLWISRDGSALMAVATVRRRGGRPVWEIDTLVSTASSDIFLMDLLDRLVATAEAERVERLFLRLPADSPILTTVRRHGFVCVTEERRYVAGDLRAAAPPDPRARLRRAADRDALFHLFAQAVPQEVRWHTALSPVEWQAAQEPLGRHGREWVLTDDEHDDAIALVRMSHDRDGARAEFLTDGTPEAERWALALALARRPVGGGLQLLVPEYAGGRAHAAESAGLEPGERFALLVRPIAQRARRLQLAEHAIEGSARPVAQ